MDAAQNNRKTEPNKAPRRSDRGAHHDRRGPVGDGPRLGGLDTVSAIAVRALAVDLSNEWHLVAQELRASGHHEEAHAITGCATGFVTSILVALGMSPDDAALIRRAALPSLGRDDDGQSGVRS